MTTTNELLARVSEVRMKHELIADLTGENFNVFSILGLQASENRTHSAFLRELLDPRGSHGMGDRFLKAFAQMLRGTLDHPEKLELNGWADSGPLQGSVRTEVHAGFKSDDLTSGGRIDLVIDLHGGCRKILIENKIYAADQECQLVRYQNSDEKALLLYLTLEGANASDYSTMSKVSSKKLVAYEDYFPISYKTHILTWLEDCVKESSGRPLVRETLVQYANLIRTLTQQNTNNLMTQEITKTVLSNKEALLSYAAMYASWDSIRIEIIKHIEMKLWGVSERQEFVTSKTTIELNTVDKNGPMLFVDNLLAENNLGIGFGVEGRTWFYGFCRLDPKNIKPDEITCSRLAKLRGNYDAPNQFWPVSRWWPDVPYWLYDQRMLADIYFDRNREGVPNFVEKVESLVKEMKTLAYEVFGESRETSGVGDSRRGANFAAVAQSSKSSSEP
jgi:hypothetical protein